MKVAKDFTFDSAHFLPKYYGKCERMHGHTYKLRVVVEVDSFGTLINKNMINVSFINKVRNEAEKIKNNSDVISKNKKNIILIEEKK